MGQRRILVIGSQCGALGRLDFLPKVAQELYRVMTDPERGACVSALEAEGLLIDPSVKDAKNAIKTVYQRAAKDEATLFIAYIGHGEKAGDDFYLLPEDAQNPPDSDTAVHLTTLIKEAHKKSLGRVDGLGVLVDACYSGVAGYGAADAWVGGLLGTLRFEVLTAAEPDRTAANGCFSRTLARLLREGVSTVPTEHLLCLHLRPLIEGECPNQVPQHPSYNPDGTLWLAKNAGRILEPWAKTPLADEIQRLTLAYQVAPALGEVVVRSRAHRCVAVVGDAGTGKSALAAALAWPKVAEGMVPARFAHAVALLTEATTPLELARVLTEQLTRSVPGFREAQQAFAHDTPYAEQQKLGALEKQVVGPLRRLAPAADVRLVVDALDRLATGARGSVMDVLNELAELPFFRLVVTARPDTELLQAALTYALAPATGEQVRQYLDRREVAQTRREEVTKAAKGNWLVVRVLADLLCERPDADIGAGQLALGDAYEELLSRCGATSNENTQRVLAVLAAAGAGPILPLSLLCTASEALGGPATAASIRDELFRLRGLAARGAVGTDAEHAGLFHQTLVEHVEVRAPEGTAAAHRALATGIQALAPTASGPVDMDDAVQCYAFERQAEHLWAVGETGQALGSLSARTSAVPRDNLRRWELWAPRVRATFGTDHPDTLTTRNNIAAWTGQCGDGREALRLIEELLPDTERVLGPHHPDTLTTRNNIAFWTGQCGEGREALRLFEELLPDQERVLGPHHPETLTTRNNIALYIGEGGDAHKALRLFEELLPDQRALGRDHPDMLRTRNSIAAWTGECGDAREALRLLEELLPDKERVLGRDHPDTLITRNNIAAWAGKCGDGREALRLFEELLPDQERVLGRDHPDTLTTRNNIAFWTGEGGEAHKPLQLFEELLPDMERVLGRDHPDMLRARNNIAFWTGKCGDAREALRLLEELLPDMERVLGRDHPDMLRTRNNIAGWTGEGGDAHKALRLLEELLPDMKRVLGPDHPDTLTMQSLIDYFRQIS